MQKRHLLPTSVSAAILAFGVVVAYGLHRVSADAAAVSVLSVSAVLAWVIAVALQVAYQCNKTVVAWIADSALLKEL